jgi:hypothetical protein
MFDNPDSYSSFKQLESKYNLPDYFLPAIRYCSHNIIFKDSKILEIGGSSLPYELLFDFLKVKQWVSVDILNHASGAYQIENFSTHYSSIGVEDLKAIKDLQPHGYQIYDGEAEVIPTSFSNYFDAVISINAFEHILNLKLTVEKAYQSLKKGGTLLAYFGPIWSGIRGSHFSLSENNINFMTDGFLPPWAHLLMDKNELIYYLKKTGQSDRTIHDVTYQLFESNFVNRFFYEDYEEIFRNSSFTSFEVAGLWDWKCPTFIKESLSNKYGVRNYDSVGLSIRAIKL